MTHDLRVQVGTCIVAALLAGQAHQNMSLGGTDASSNAAGVQARWDDGGVFAAVFVGGTTLDAVASGKRPEGDAALVLAVSERPSDGGLLTYLWTPRVEQTIRGTQAMPGRAGSESARALFQQAAARFHGMHTAPESGDEHTPRAKADAPAPQPAPPDEARKTRGAGSTLSGLPALSVDSSAHIVQAGWVESTRRYGVLARGRWRMAAHAQMTSDEQGDWLVVFELDRSTGRIALLQAIHGAGGVGIGLSVDGAVRPFDAVAGAWAGRVLAWLDREVSRHSDPRNTAVASK